MPSGKTPRKRKRAGSAVPRDSGTDVEESGHRRKRKRVVKKSGKKESSTSSVKGTESFSDWSGDELDSEDTEDFESSLTSTFQGGASDASTDFGEEGDDDEDDDDYSEDESFDDDSDSLSQTALDFELATLKLSTRSRSIGARMRGRKTAFITTAKLQGSVEMDDLKGDVEMTESKDGIKKRISDGSELDATIELADELEDQREAITPSAVARKKGIKRTLSDRRMGRKLLRVWNASEVGSDASLTAAKLKIEEFKAEKREERRRNAFDVYSETMARCKADYSRVLDKLQSVQLTVPFPKESTDDTTMALATVLYLENSPTAKQKHEVAVSKQGTGGLPYTCQMTNVQVFDSDTDIHSVVEIGKDKDKTDGMDVDTLSDAKLVSDKTVDGMDIDETKEDSSVLVTTGTPSPVLSIAKRAEMSVATRMIPLNQKTVAMPRASAYISVSRSHFAANDKSLLHTCHFDESDLQWMDETRVFSDDSNEDSDTEFDESDDLLVDCLTKAEMDASDGSEMTDAMSTVALKLYGLSSDRIESRKAKLSRESAKECEKGKANLLSQGYDLEEIDDPLDSYRSLFCSRDATYHCTLHGCHNPPKSGCEIATIPQLKQKPLIEDWRQRSNCRVDDKSDPCMVPIPKQLTGEQRKQFAQLVADTLPTDFRPLPLRKPLEVCSKTCFRQAAVEQTDASMSTDSKKWSQYDENILRMLASMYGRDVCAIRDCFPTDKYTCAEIHTKICALIPGFDQTKASTPASGLVLAEDIKETESAETSDKMSSSPKAKGKRRKRKRKSLLFSEASDRLARRIVAKDKFEPCAHEGDCNASNGCVCAKAGRNCEKYCKCLAESCSRRFAGCQCQTGECRTARCRCFAAHRECDPDLCRSCQSYLPPPVMRTARLLAAQRADTGASDELGDGSSEQLAVVCGVSGVRLSALCNNVSCRQREWKKLAAGKSRIHGLGCFAAEAIRRGELVTEYLGEVLTQEESERRGAIYDKMNLSYLFDLNRDYVLDASRFGSVIKFANHSEDKANCASKTLLTSGEHRICIYAKKDIKQGEELLFDYRHDANEHIGSKPEWFSAA